MDPPDSILAHPPFAGAISHADIPAIYSQSSAREATRQNNYQPIRAWNRRVIGYDYLYLWQFLREIYGDGLVVFHVHYYFVVEQLSAYEGIIGARVYAYI